MIDTGVGPAVVLLHGFPHTHRLWELVVPRLSESYRVIAPDLVAGGSALELAGWLAGLLDSLGVERTAVVGIDAGVPAAVGFALEHPARTDRLAVMEAVLPGIAGAEAFAQRGLPWWFGFHQVPGLAEKVLVGHEREYIEWFLRAGTVDGAGIGPELTDAFASAYTGTQALASAFEHYRAMPRTAQELTPLLRERRLNLPVLAIGAQPVGPVLASQLSASADNLTAVQFDDCGHLIPLDAPDRLLAALLPWLNNV
ncbi:pimeloyl-ACP methyl ester carboxylesterase [Kribbella sp. VKM Ac-2569]|uniref:alpha/beta fold hydrolase n=1 Tax=Kribbella sp. VKM Ac-2569 TaxID=2512220 RepID=UPI00102CA5C7|nr:alpha/beta hydrolase [Kribbella sp. VKM Ac-2569]RZT16871.1 pimeloyl-ACP methyl ester carboxylesterase [Kribbella sp. VKM Ac-2569]